MTDNRDATRGAVQELLAIGHRRSAFIGGVSAEAPTAIFTAQNLISMGAVRVLRSLGVERSIAQVGFEDFELADILNPGATVVAQDPRRMGRLAAEALFARIADATRPPAITVVPPELIKRGSGEIPPLR